MKEKTIQGLLLACLLTATASAAAPATTPDPLEPLNRKVLAFNYVVDRALLKPASVVYRTVVPGFARTGVRNFLDNILEPRTVLNQCLQGKFKAAASDTGRFVVNTTLGIGGLFDPATAMGLQRHREDFGQTLGRWGIGPGPYLVLPVIGSSTLRDGPAKLVDVATGPMNTVDDTGVRLGIGALDRIDNRSRLLGADNELGDDPYVYLRDAYLERRQAEIRD